MLWGSVTRQVASVVMLVLRRNVYVTVGRCPWGALRSKPDVLCTFTNTVTGSTDSAAVVQLNGHCG